jgi:protein-S-isoprenylcysteine O-methyltransferase Ste14
MFARALLAFVALPGTVAFIIPVTWLWYSRHLQIVYPVGFVPLAAGILTILWCIRDFYVSGKGTLSPWAPPQILVVVGLYRFSRNPMYISVILILFGWTVSFSSMPLFVYAMAIIIAFHLRVVFGEEPVLAQKFDGEWESYARRVPRWFW